MISSKQELQSGDYAVEVTEGFGTSTRGYARYNSFFIKDHRGESIFNLKQSSRSGKYNYRINGVHDGEKLGEVNGGLLGSLGSFTISEVKSKTKSKVKFRQSDTEVLIETKSGTYHSPKITVTDHFLTYNVYDNQNQLILSVQRPKRFQKVDDTPYKLATIRNLGNLGSFLACAIGMSIVIFSMLYGTTTSRVELLNRSTVINIEKKKSSYIFTDESGQEVLRGGKSGKSKLTFTDQSGHPVGQIQRNKRNIKLSEWTLTDMQHGTTGTLDIGKRVWLFGRWDKYDNSLNQLSVANERFTFGDLHHNSELHDSNGLLCYSISGFNKQFKIDIKKGLTVNFWCFVTVCLIEKIFTRRKSR